VTIIATPNRRFRDAALRAPKAARGRETETIPMVFAQGWILAERGDSRRAQLEQFVADVYAHAYRAELNEFPPMLAAITDPNDRPVGVIGARPAAEGPLFLEQYLDAPIECFVSARLATPIPRARIAEVGSLASTTPGFGKALMSSLAAYLDGAGFDVAVFTATRQLRNSIRKWNATTFDFGPANGDRLGEDRAHWGAYYDTDPHVLAVHLKSFRACVGADAPLSAMLRGVWQDAWCDGSAHCRLERAS